MMGRQNWLKRLKKLEMPKLDVGLFRFLTLFGVPTLSAPGTDVWRWFLKSVMPLKHFEPFQLSAGEAR